MPMPSHFTPDLFQFLRQLKHNNNRDWFLRHKQEYESVVRGPALRFLADFAADLSNISPYLIIGPRSLFRIYRDIRFSSDKRPYKTHLAMRFSLAGRDVHSPGFYLHLEPENCFSAAGLWPPQRQT